MASPKSRPRDGYPGRALCLILAVAVVLVATMFATGNKTPRLGVDLAGGTTMTLTAHTTAGQKSSAINPTSMNEAASIIQQRINGTGVTEGTSQVEGSDNIIVTVPKSTDTTTLEALVGTTAKLYFRTVSATATQASAAAVASASASATASPSATSTGSATPKASTSATAKVSSASSTPTPTASKTQGDAVTGDLTAASGSASATAKDTAKATTTPTAAATTPATSSTSAANKSVTYETSGTVPTDLTSAFAALDCTNSKARAAAQTVAGADANVGKNVVSCQEMSPGVYTKYALGPVAVNGTDVSSASAQIGSSGAWQINLNFNSKGAKEFAAVTTKLYAQTADTPGNMFAIVLDGAVISAPGVEGAITGGTAQITGTFTQQQANDLANQLSYGALPLSFVKSDVTTVSPELGGSQLTAGLIAGAIGLALVILYCLAYYRALGLVAVASLGVSAVLTYSIMSLLGGAIGFALNLPAVCGAIVAIGITADSFVVYFERIRDEVRMGSSLRPAVQRAWPRARRTILVSDFVSFLAAAVLYFFTVGKVQGFAFTLGLTTLLDIVVIFLFTKPLITLLARTKFFSGGSPMSGLSPERLGARSPLRDSRRRPTAPKEA